jgi:hypothetical protein
VALVPLLSILNQNSSPIQFIAAHQHLGRAEKNGEALNSALAANSAEVHLNAGAAAAHHKHLNAELQRGLNQQRLTIEADDDGLSVEIEGLSASPDQLS